MFLLGVMPCLHIFALPTSTLQVLRLPNLLQQLTVPAAPASTWAPALTSCDSLDDPPEDLSTNGLLRVFPPSGCCLDANHLLHYQKHAHTQLSADMTLTAVVSLLLRFVRLGRDMRACALWALQGMIRWADESRHHGAQMTLANELIGIVCDQSRGHGAAEQVLRTQLVRLLDSIVLQATPASLVQFVAHVRTEVTEVCRLLTTPGAWLSEIEPESCSFSN